MATKNTLRGEQLTGAAPVDVEERVFVRIELTKSAKAVFHADCEARGMTQIAYMSRLLSWFALQDEAVRMAVLGHIPAALAPDVNALIAKRLLAIGR